MKKLFFLPVIALAIVSCSDNDGPWGTPQENEQLPIFTLGDLHADAAPETQGTIDLKYYNDENALVPVLNITKLENFPAGYELDFVMQMSRDQSTVGGIDIPTKTVAVDGGGVWVGVSPDDWQDAYTSFISKGPKAKEVALRFAPFAVKGSERVRLGLPEQYMNPMTVTVKPFPSEFVIEDSYYLLGTINGWDVATAVKFEHSDADVYDDPVFTLNITANGDWWWKIVPQSTYETGNWVDAANASFGVAENGSDALSGILAPRTATADCGAGCLKVSGPYKLTINMEELTYEFTQAIERLYTPGSANGWNFAGAQTLVTNDYANYKGFALLGADGFKFTSMAGWDGVNFGMGAAAGELSTDGGAGNITVPADGLYWCNVNIAELKYSTDVINTIGAIGDFNGWGSSVALTPDGGDKLVWTGTVDFGDGNGGFKLRCNDDWAISLGGDINNLGWDNAPNISAPGAGKYTVTLFLDAYPYVVEFEKN